MAAPSVTRIAAANGVSYAVAIGVSFIQAPFLIHSLGDSRYGTWALIGLIMGYYGLFDLGTRGAVAYFVARARAREDFGELRQITATAFWFLSSVAVGVILLGTAVLGFFPDLLNIADVARSETQIALFIALVVTAITLPLDVFAAVVNGCRRSEIITVSESAVRIAAMLAIFILLPEWNRLYVLAGINAAAKLIGWTIAWIGARHLEPSSTVFPRDASRAHLRRIAGYGLTTLGITTASTFIERIDSVLIAAFLGTTSVTYFVIGQSLTGYLASGVYSVTLAFTPFFADLGARDETTRSQALFLAGTRASSLVAGTIAGGLIAFGTPFISLWVGKQYVTGPITDRSDVVMILLLVAIMPRLLLSTGHQYLFGTNQHGKLTWILVGEAAAKVILTVFFVRSWGIAGAALGSVLPSLVSHGWVVPRMIARSLGISHLTIISEGQRPGLLATTIVLLCSLAGGSIVAPTTWIRFFAAGTVAMILATPLLWFGALRSEERQRVLVLFSRRAPGPV